MIKWTFDPDALAQHIAALSLADRIPVLTVQQGSAMLKRHQKKKYASAICFSAPVNILDCGRYNPPGGEPAVWYAADSSVTAAAEAYGRLLQLTGQIAYPESVLEQHFICAIDVLRPVTVIDLIGLCQSLHVPLDSVENEDYAFPQWLMAHLYTHFGSECDGVAYSSRHYRYRRCYAFWPSPTMPAAFQDTPGGMVPVADYKEYDRAIFPADWEAPFMSGDEILEALLNFRITAEPM